MWTQRFSVLIFSTNSNYEVENDLGEVDLTSLPPNLGSDRNCKI